MTLVRFPYVRAAPSVPGVARISAEDKQFALRLGAVLRELRAQTGWTQDQAAERGGLVTGTLGRWERGEHAPKGYDVGRLFRLYEPFGAQADWFFDPPEVLVTNPVRDRLSEIARGAASLAREDLEEARAKRQAAEDKRAARRGKRPA